MIQQAGTSMAKFNLGRLKNIGFHLASLEMTESAKPYYVLSDVDLLPSNGLCESYLQYPKTPIHLGHRGTRYEVPKKSKKHTFLGGVVSVSYDDFVKVNGYPNNFFGWGGEDECLNHRLHRNKVSIQAPEHPVIDLEELTIKDKLALLKKQQAKDMRKTEKIKLDETTWESNGLSNLEGSYEILSRDAYESYDNVSHIVVRLHITDTDRQEL